MDFKFNNGKTLVIPERFLNFKKKEKGFWNERTSFMEEFLSKNSPGNFSFFKGEFFGRLKCLENIKNRIAGTYNSFLDILGGAGFTAKLFEENPGETYVNDLDEVCLEILKENFPLKNVTSEDAFNFPYLQSYDCIFVDFNNFTYFKMLETYRDSVRGYFNYANKYVILNDCSVFHLNYGKKSYENYSKRLRYPVSTREEFFQVLKVKYEQFFPDWKLVHVEHFHKSSYLLFEKNSLADSLTLNYNDKESLAKQKDPVHFHDLSAVKLF